MHSVSPAEDHEELERCRVIKPTNVKGNWSRGTRLIGCACCVESTKYSLDADILYCSTVVSSTFDSGDPQSLLEASARNLIERGGIDPNEIRELFSSFPKLIDAVLKKDVDEVMTEMMSVKRSQEKIEQERISLLRRIQNNPLDVDAQRLLEQMIKQQNIDEALNLAQEHLPESFGAVFMLYIQVEVNGVPMKAFVDSGAQSTIMSKACADRCNLTRLLDTRFHGIARGVGTSKIVGRIHLAQLKIGNKFYPASFTVLEDDKVEFLFGLDLLKRHQCCIDLKDNCLRIGGDAVQFLSEMETKADTINKHSSTSNPSRAEREIDERKIKGLVDIGFSKSEAENALRAAEGNLELAASMLFQEHR